MKVCLVCVVVGDNYYSQYERIFMNSHKVYAEKHSYNFKIIKDILGYQNMDLISLSKQLICGQEWAKEYDFIVVVDADIYINKDSPAIHLECLNTDKIGMVNEITQPTRELRRKFQEMKGYETTTREYFAASGLNFSEDIMYNGGLFVFQPKKHYELCKNIYYKHCEKQVGNPRGLHYEQATINYEYYNSNMIFTLDNKWNAIWAVNKPYFMGTIYDFVKSNYFTHLAGREDYNLLENLVNMRRL